MPRFSIWFLFLMLIFPAGCALQPAGSSIPTVTSAPPANIRAVDGKLPNQVERLEKVMPRAGTEGFVIPTSEEMTAFSGLVEKLRSGDVTEAGGVAASHEYELLWYTDTGDDDAVSYVLREWNPAKKGWGLYVFRQASTNHLIIEAPHPLADGGTPFVAVDLYRALDARSVLIAGSHRDANRDGSADAAHEARTIFQAIHLAELQQTLDDGNSALVLQLHGFASSKHPSYPQVILGFDAGGNTNPVDLMSGSSLVNKLADALRKSGIRVGVCGNNQWRDLCGEANIQAAPMTRGIFIHLEMDETVRESPSDFIKALKQVLLP